jgi:hypothetical protein
MAAVFTANQSQLVNDAAQYRVPVINKHSRKALLAYAYVLQLKAIAGTDYTANYPLLFSNAAIATKGSDQDTIEAARLNLEFLAAETAAVGGLLGTTVPATVSAKLLAATPLLNQPDPILDQVILYLVCSIYALIYNP